MSKLKEKLKSMYLDYGDEDQLILDAVHHHINLGTSGSFTHHLMNAYLCASPNNREKIEESFEDVFLNLIKNYLPL